MKNITNNLVGKFSNKFLAAFAAIFLLSTNAMAEMDIDVDVNKGGGWYTNPIYWVIGGVVLILVVALIARGGGKK